MLLIAVERCREAMVVAMEKARDMELKNVFFIDMDVAKMEEIFAPGEIDRLFINFPDPWPRKKNAKRRLTHRTFLDKYCRTVREGGEVITRIPLVAKTTIPRLTFGELYRAILQLACSAGG